MTISASASASGSTPSLHHHLTNILHSTTATLLSLHSKTSPFRSLRQPKICMPFQFADSPYPLATSQPTRSPFDSTPCDSVSSSNSPTAVKNSLPYTESNSGFPSTVRIAGLNSNGVKGGGPAFVGQVFSMCDLSGTGLMAVSTHFDIPFISKRMLSLKCPLSLIPFRSESSKVFRVSGFESIKISERRNSTLVCAQKGPRPRYPRVWKTKRRIGTVSKSAKLVSCVKGLSNVKEEVYGALDSFIAWELEFPLIAVKKALKILESEQEWKRIIQVTKWMLSKGQGKTMGTYFTLLNALAEDGRLEEAEDLWTRLFSENLESMPRKFFDKMVSIYYRRDVHEKMFEIFADMEELSIRPSVAIVSMMGNVFKKLDMLDKYEKLKKKYPPPKWEFRYIKGKHVRIRAKHPAERRVYTKSNDVSNNTKILPISDDLENASDEDFDRAVDVDYTNTDVSHNAELLQTSNDLEKATDEDSGEAIDVDYMNRDFSHTMEFLQNSNDLDESSDEDSLKAVDV